jgi:hypothetical protein
MSDSIINDHVPTITALISSIPVTSTFKTLSAFQNRTSPVQTAVVALCLEWELVHWAMLMWDSL